MAIAPAKPRRALGAAAFVVGLVLVALILLVVVFDASRGGPGAVTPVGPYVGNGTATYLLPLPYGGYTPTSTISGTWSFPHEAGRFLLVRCDEAQALTAGEPIPDPVRADPPAMGGSVTLRGQDLFFSPGREARAFCGPDVMALQWPAGADATLNEPTVSLVATSAPFGSGSPVVALLVVGGTGVLLVGLGGAAWLAGRRPAPGEADEHESTAETLLQLTDRSIGWLERMRRYLLLGGVLGIFVWYPVLLGVAWGLLANATTGTAIPAVVVVLALALLGTLTALWAREYARIDRELKGWRERLERLKRREEEMMERFANL